MTKMLAYCDWIVQKSIFLVQDNSLAISKMIGVTDITNTTFHLKKIVSLKDVKFFLQYIDMINLL
jgi:hypothetical protein